jgi:hypothetical protein
MPQVIGDYDVVRKAYRRPLDEQQEFERERIGACIELGGIELGQDIMNVQDHRHAA